MKILQVTPYFAPAWAYGGPPRVMFEYATGLVARGHEVAVFTTDVLDEHMRATPSRETIDGVDVRGASMGEASSDDVAGVGFKSVGAEPAGVAQLVSALLHPCARCAWCGWAAGGQQHSEKCERGADPSTRCARSG